MTDPLPRRLAARFGARVACALLAGAAFAVPARAQDAGHLDVHGYLTQGWAQSDGTKFYGIRGDASTDFRYAALQFRYARGRDAFLIQLNHRRLGESPITDFESSVSLNWAFYERRTEGGEGRVRVGRIPVPRGIYNEQRNIGVVLPFYRVPVIFYDEAAYYSETLDGVTGLWKFGASEPWGLDAHVYAGGWSLLAYDQSGDTYAVGRVRAENAVGTQLWVHTPVEGVRVGASAQAYHWKSIDEEGSLVAKQHVWEAQGSLDVTRSRAAFRAETMLQNYETDDYYANHAQLGVKTVERLWLWAQGEYAYERNYQSSSYPESFDWHKALGVSAVYTVAPGFVLKAEHHWNKGIQVEQPATPLAPPRFNYSILSASASF